jgi:hypothetical protein
VEELIEARNALRTKAERIRKEKGSHHEDYVAAMRDLQTAENCIEDQKHEQD